MRLLSHWIEHNGDHALNYRNWAEKAKTNGKGQAAGLLEEAAELSLAVNEKFEAALAEFDGELNGFHPEIGKPDYPTHPASG